MDKNNKENVRRTHSESNLFQNLIISKILSKTNLLNSILLILSNNFYINDFFRRINRNLILRLKSNNKKGLTNILFNLNNKLNYGEDEDYSSYVTFTDSFYDEMAKQQISKNVFYDNNNLNKIIKKIYDIINNE